MTKDQAIKFFGTQEKTAAAAGVTQSCVSQWGDYPPYMRQILMQRASRGKIKAEKIGRVLRSARTVKVV